MPPKIKRTPIEILRSHPVSTLKKEVSKQNRFKGYSKLNKEELIKLMTKNTSVYNNFKYIKYRETKKEKATREAVEGKPKAKAKAPKQKKQTIMGSDGKFKTVFS
jgi:hypothetical protein